jgi:DNA-binding transcriptional LysR family regulator
VARLEVHLGTALLRRQGRRVEATEEGRLYREKAGMAVDVLQDAAETLRAAHAAPSGLLRVTASPGIGSVVLGPVLPGFLQAYPGISLELLLTEAVLSFREHRFDVALRLAQGLPDSSLVARRLFAVTMVLAASPDYVARCGVPADPAELRARDFLTVPVDATQRLTFERMGGGREQVQVYVAGRVRSHDLLLLRDLALAGAGITALLPHVAEADIAAGRMVHILPDWRLASPASLYVMHAGGVLSPKVRAFRDYVLAPLAAPLHVNPRG